MNPIQSVLIVGAGAIGAAVASVVEQHLPGAVKILADADRLERYRRDGFVVNGRRWDFALVDPDTPCDCGLVIVAVKNHHLPDAIEQMRKVVSKDAVILSLMNGISSEETLRAAFGEDRVPYAMIIAIDALREGNVTTFSIGGTVNFGDARNAPGAWSPKVEAVADFLSRAGVPYVVPENMLRTLWYKWMINVGINQASAIVRAPYRTFQTIPAAHDLMAALMNEVIALSSAAGTGLAASDLDNWMGTLNRLGPEGKTSMLQDVEASRKTEVEAFAGTVAALGERYGVPVPANRFALLAIMAIEKSYGA